MGSVDTVIEDTMGTKRPTPDIEDCIALYLDVWDLFEQRTFEPEELTERLVEHDRDVGYVTGEGDPGRHLDVLVEYGLVARTDGQYRIKCTPDEEIAAWREKLQTPPEAIHRLVQETKARRRGAATAGGEDTLERDGERFVSISADEATEVRDVVSAMTDRLGEPPRHAGIVVRTPADLTGHVQRLADELCDADAMADADLPYRFEKVTSNIRGEHKDDIEYRLYLRTVRR